MYAPSIMISKMNKTKTIAAPDTPVLHIIHTSFLSFHIIHITAENAYTDTRIFLPSDGFTQYLMFKDNSFMISSLPDMVNYNIMHIHLRLYHTG